jgi:hypothetical protein
VVRTMAKRSTDCTPVLDALARFAEACGTDAAAAERLGISKSAFSKWFKKRALKTGTLQSLAAFEGDAAVAEAARQALARMGISLASFDFGHIAAQLMCAGPSAYTLSPSIQKNAPVEELEFAAAQDLIAALADTHFYETFAELALEGFPFVPEHPLIKMGTSSYEEELFPNKDLADVYRDAKGKIDWDGISKHIREPHVRRAEAARAIWECAVHEPGHRLFERILESTACLGKERDANTPTLKPDAYLEMATFAAVDAYKLESTVIEASKTIRQAIDSERALEKSPLYTIATRLWEMRHPLRQQTVGRVTWLKERLSENKDAVRKIDGICEFVYQALYSNKGAYFFHAGFATAQVNKHGSVVDYDSGRLVRSIVGKKRHAPKRAIVRANSRRSKK